MALDNGKILEDLGKEQVIKDVQAFTEEMKEISQNLGRDIMSGIASKEDLTSTTPLYLYS